MRKGGYFEEEIDKGTLSGADFWESPSGGLARVKKKENQVW